MYSCALSTAWCQVCTMRTKRISEILCLVQYVAKKGLKLERLNINYQHLSASEPRVLLRHSKNSHYKAENSSVSEARPCGILTIAKCCLVTQREEGKMQMTARQKHVLGGNQYLARSSDGDGTVRRKVEKAKRKEKQRSSGIGSGSNSAL